MTTRTPLLAGNWKMHGARAEALALAGALVKSVGQTRDREVVLAPPFTALEPVGQAIAGSALRLGAQNAYWEPKGAFTGEISVPMVKEAGCTYVIVGHSERRQLFGETNETVNLRTQAVLAGGLVPIVCVGETLAEREADATGAVIERQIESALGTLRSDQLQTCVVASAGQAQEVHHAIRRQLAALGSQTTAGRIRIIYGGSVKPDNVDGLMAEPDIDGALVGGASLDPVAFTRIVQYKESR